MTSRSILLISLLNSTSYPSCSTHPAGEPEHDRLVKKLPYDLSSHAGLALVGKYLKHINVNALIDPAFAVRSGVTNSDILKSYLGLRAVPSSPTLRQRLDTHASDWFELTAQIHRPLQGSRPGGKVIDFGALSCGYTPIDLDTFAMENGGTMKELVGRTYARVDGYCPFAVYLGTLGYCLELALRPEVQRSAKESEDNLARALPMAASLVATPLLLCADSGFCSVRLMQEINQQAQTLGREIAFIIKWNLRTAPVETVAAQEVADAAVAWVSARPGKRVCLWQETLDLAGVGSPSNPARRVRGKTRPESCRRNTTRHATAHATHLVSRGELAQGFISTYSANIGKFENKNQRGGLGSRIQDSNWLLP